MPLITYITVVRNGVNQIEQTMKSILPFRGGEVEYIIIDGGSDDGTLDIIKETQAEIDKWISVPDKGIYDAMNKGLRMATGKFVCFINAGDQLLNCPLKQIENVLNTDAAAISFSVKLSNGKIFLPSFSRKIKWENTLHHQGTYYRKNRVGEYNLSFRIFSDFDLNQILFKDNKKIVIDRTIINSIHALDGISQDKKNINEIFKIVNKNYGAFFCIISFFHFKIKYGLRNKLRLLTQPASSFFLWIFY